VFCGPDIFADVLQVRISEGKFRWMVIFYALDKTGLNMTDSA
jgi:hypothetical protein